MMTTKIIHGKVISGGSIVERDVYINNGRIVPFVSQPDEIVDAAGKYVSPGFIDLHVHGGAGHDFMDGTPEAFLGAAEFHARRGTTAMCPTALSGSMQETMQVIAAYKTACERNQKGSDFIGLHLEGPYFALSQKGAQDERYVHAPVKEEYEAILSQGADIVRWSAAPELDQGYAFAKRLREKGILISAGHTDATCAQMLEAAANGYTHMTHFYSCMKSVERVNGIRIAGAVEAAYLDDNITVEIIADGMHLPPELLRLIYKLKGPDKVALITDAMRGAGCPEGSESILGSLTNGQRVFLENGVAMLPSRQAFAGSIATTDRLVRTVVAAGIPLADAVKMATETPAKIIGCSFKGSLEPGKDADLVLFDDAITISAVYIRGRRII